MKKIIALILFVSTMLTALAAFTACGEDTDNYKLKVGYLSGPTGMGMAKLIEDDKNSESPSYEFKQFSDPNTAVTEIISGQLDLACVPTNTASVLYNRTNGQVDVLALNTLGVLYLLEDGNTITSLSDLRGKTIYASVPGSTTEYILNHILTTAGIDPENDVDIIYEPDHDALVAKIVTGEAKLAVLPEPKVTAALVQSGKESLRIAMSLTEEWDKISDTPLVQGCIVARKGIIDEHKSVIDKFLSDYEASINYIKNPDNLDSAAQLIVSAGIIPKLPIAKTALPNSNITYIDGADMKSALSDFLTVLYQSNPQSIGGSMPEDDFYYAK